MTRVAQLHAELTQLRSGPGLQSPRLRSKVGSALLAACAVAPDDDEAEIRRKITELVILLSGRLTDDDARAAQVALNIHPECRSRFLQDRMDCLGVLIDRERRTAVRRVDDAFHLLAELLEGPLAQPSGSRFAPGGWYFDALRSNLELDEHRLTLTEWRTITATVDELDRLTVGWSTERSAEYDGRFDVELLSGGVLVPDRARIGDGAWAGEVHLPRALTAGQSHEYCTRVTQSGKVEPYYIVTPFRRTNLFQARVIFRSVPAPVRAWRVAGEPARFVDEIIPDRAMLDVDDAGELTAVFEHLDIGLSYGIRWSAGEA